MERVVLPSHAFSPLKRGWALKEGKTQAQGSRKLCLVAHSGWSNFVCGVHQVRKDSGKI